MATVSTTSPIGGWNARDALDKMPDSDAVKLVNWIPRAGYCQTRGGHAVHAPGLGGSVNTLAAYRGATEVFIAGANGKLWNITTSTPVSLATGFTNDRWQTTNHS